MKRKFIVFLATVAVSSQVILAANINLIINGKVIESSVSPVQEQGTTLVPLRVVSEELGAKVQWDKATQKITISKGKINIQLTVGSKKAIVNNKAETLIVAPVLKKGTTMVPLRFVSEKLNVPVDWDSKTGTVLINSSKDDLKKIKKTISSDKALEIVRQKMGTSFDYKFEGTVSGDYHVYGEDGSNFYLFYAMQDGSILDGAIYVQKETGKVYLATPDGSVQEVTNTTTSNNSKGKLTEAQIIKIAKDNLGNGVSCTNTFNQVVQKYYYFTTTTSPYVDIIIREDGQLFDAYTYNAEGILQPL